MITKSTFKASRKFNRVVVILALLTLLVFAFVSIASAHQTVTIGDYDVEYGWVSEPAVVGQSNDLVLNLTLTGSSGPSEVDVSGLSVQAVYGDQSKMLALQPLGEDTPGQFVAPLTPTLPGTYTIYLSGRVGNSDFNNDITPEEVQTADVVEFPLSIVAPTLVQNPLGLTGWLAIAAIIIGIASLSLSSIVLLSRSKP